MGARCKVFISYSHEDERLKDSKVKIGVGYPRAFLSRMSAAIKPHDDVLTKDEIFFDDDRLAIEWVWGGAIEKALDECDLLIFLVSPHSIESDFCMTKELPRALQRNIPVITVLLRPSADWYLVKVRDPVSGSSMKLGAFHSGGLPKEGGNAKAVSTWANEEDAWENVCKDILKFIKKHLGPMGEALETPATAPVAVQEMAVEKAPSIVPLPDQAESPMCRILRGYLERHWEQARLADIFSNADLIQGIALPPTVDGVVQFAASNDDCCENLGEVVGCLGEISENKGFGEHVQGALVRMILVIAESYLRSVAIKAGYRPERADPIWEQEILVASVIAAERLGFGLSFKGGKREPENVLEIKPPMSELGNPDEEGPGLVRSEVLRALDRRQPASEVAPTAEYFARLVQKKRKSLGSDIVVTAVAEGSYAETKARAALQHFLGQYEIHAFFRAAERQAAPAWAAGVIGDVQHALGAAFPPAKKSGDEQMANQGNSGNSGAAVNIQINAQMSGVLNLGDHTHVAGRDINLGNPADWGKVAQAVQALHDAIAALADGAPQKAALLADVKDVGDAVAAGKPKDGDAKLVKRCLEGLKQGAEAAENGEKIIEKVTPVWDGLKSAWPAFLALIS
jgi:hypothetical protein